MNSSTYFESMHLSGPKTTFFRVTSLGELLAIKNIHKDAVIVVGNSKIGAWMYVGLVMRWETSSDGKLDVCFFKSLGFWTQIHLFVFTYFSLIKRTHQKYSFKQNCNEISSSSVVLSKFFIGWMPCNSLHIRSIIYLNYWKIIWRHCSFSDTFYLFWSHISVDHNLLLLNIFFF